MAVLLGLGLVAGPAAGLDVGVGGGPAVGYRVDVVVLEAPALAAVVAFSSGELRYGAEVEGGAQLVGQVAAEAFDGVDVDPVVPSLDTS